MLHEKDKEYLQDLLARYEQGTCNEQEAKFVEQYFDYLDAWHANRDPFQVSGPESRAQVEAAIREKLFAAIRSPQEETGKLIRWSRFYRMTAAAAVLLIVASLGYWFFTGRQTTPDPVAQEEAVDFRPGSNRAVLSVENGKSIVLDSNSGNIIAEAGLTVTNNNGELSYEGEAGSEQMHTLSVPVGGQYRLQLPDGSDVWLNSASSIRYPSAFHGKERIVEVTGEVYFEVAKRAQQPFKVHMPKGEEVEVLGTHFNINTYEDEPASVTTLLEGSIQFATAGKKVLLSPGQQARSKAAGDVLLLRGVDTDAVIAWKEGYFNFNGADLPTVMRQIARWYNVSVRYEGPVPDMKFSGEIAKSNQASMVLKMLEAANVKFQIEGNTIIVRQ